MTTKGLTEGNVMEVVDCVPTCFEECTHEIGPPKRGKNIDERFIRTSSDVRFCDEHGNTLGQSVIAPKRRECGERGWLRRKDRSTGANRARKDNARRKRTRDPRCGHAISGNRKSGSSRKFSLPHPARPQCLCLRPRRSGLLV